MNRRPLLHAAMVIAATAYFLLTPARFLLLDALAVLILVNNVLALAILIKNRFWPRDPDPHHQILMEEQAWLAARKTEPEEPR